MRSQTKLVAAVAAMFSSSVAFGDGLVGGGPAPGMAGAGLALPKNIGQNNLLNPAMLGFARRGLSLNFPYLGYHLKNLSIGDINDLISANDGGISNNKLISFGRKYGDQPKELGLQAGLGAEVYGFALNLTSEVDVTTIPNAILEGYAKSGNINNADASAELDAYGIGYGQAEAGYGDAIRLKSGLISFGGAAKYIVADYAHKVVNGTSFNGTGIQPTNGTDIPNGNTVQKTGLGVDLGTIYNPTCAPDMYFGAVLENAVQPNIKFDQTPVNPNGLLAAPAIQRGAIDLWRTALDIGFGSVIAKKTLVAADLIDVTNNASRQDLRLGADYAINKVLSVRAGYSSRTSFTVGFGVLGINFAIGGQLPLTIGTSAKF